MALVLSRSVGEKVIIGGNVVVQVLAVRSGNKISLGISAPAEIAIMREELLPPYRDERHEPGTKLACGGR